MNDKTSRRAVLIGAAALPVLSISALADVAPIEPAAPIPHPSEAKLLRIEAEYWRADAAMRLATRKTRIAGRRYDKLNKLDPNPHPVDVMANKMPDDLNKLFRSMTVGEHAKLADDHPLKIYMRKTEADSGQLELRYRSKRRKAKKKSGLAAAEREFDRCVDECWRVARKALALRAATIPGMEVKVRIIQHLGREDFAEGWKSVSRDIVAIARART